jgi:hypothetical protein
MEPEILLLLAGFAVLIGLIGWVIMRVIKDERARLQKIQGEAATTAPTWVLECPHCQRRVSVGTAKEKAKMQCPSCLNLFCVPRVQRPRPPITAFSGHFRFKIGVLCAAAFFFGLYHLGKALLEDWERGIFDREGIEVSAKVVRFIDREPRESPDTLVVSFPVNGQMRERELPVRGFDEAWRSRSCKVRYLESNPQRAMVVQPDRRRPGGLWIIAAIPVLGAFGLWRLFLRKPPTHHNGIPYARLG